MSTTDQDRFWSKVDKSGECWIWMATRNKKGYGRFRVNGKMAGAHRYSYELAHGPIPDNLKACHKCDTPACCRPDHIFIGTHADNVRDRDAKGRQARVRGERNGQAKLTEGQVQEIRNLYATGGLAQRELGRRFGVAKVTIYKIVHGKIWKTKSKEF